MFEFYRRMCIAFHQLGSKNNILEAAGTAIDIITELNGEHGVVFINMAPRCEENNNGVDFVYFWHKKTLIISVNEPVIFGMFYRFKIKSNTVRLINCNEKRFEKTQFRSMRVIPIILKEILHGKYEGSLCEIIREYPESCIWFIDNFGNCKLTSDPEPFHDYFARSLHLKDQMISINGELIDYYLHLADVPKGETGCILGSSGSNVRHGLELVLGHGSLPISTT